MKTKIRGGIVHLTKYVLFFSIILLLSCTSTSVMRLEGNAVMRLEGNDFKENLPGLWEGRWYLRNKYSGKVRIKISKIDGNKVHLTGFKEIFRGGDTDEVSGRIENSTLLLSWPNSITDEYVMKRVDSNNLILKGHWFSEGWIDRVQLKKIE